MKYSGNSSGGFGGQFEVSDSDKFNTIFWSKEFQSSVIMLRADTVDSFMKEYGISYIYELYLGPCGHSIYYIKDNIFEDTFKDDGKRLIFP